jgi:EAL domain-containing protein (putative c-di-GMP-specific phosphodiesterase class I)
MQLLLKTIRAHYGMEAAFVSQFLGDLRQFEAVDSSVDFRSVDLVPGGRGPLAESYCYGVASGTIPELIRDAQAAPEVRHLAATAAVPIGAHISVPIRRSTGEVYGTLCAFSRTADATLTSRDLAMLRLCADFLAHDIEQVQDHEREQQPHGDLIERVISRTAFDLALQPIVALSDRSTAGFEALTRFRSEVGGPQPVFDLAARTGLLEDLELAVLREAISRFDFAVPGPYLSINVSPDTILGRRLERLLRKAPKDRIVLELTEHSRVEDYHRLVDRTKTLRAQGVRIAVDDAGAGYASFRHVVLVQPDIIKLDRSLISKIDASPELRSMVKALTDYAGATRSTVVAEGIEREKEVEALERLAVPLGQGYLLGRPRLLTKPGAFDET